MSFLWMVAVLAVVWALAYFRSPLWLWTLSLAAVLGFATWACPLASAAGIVLWTAFFLVAIPLNLTPLRRALFSRPLFTVFKRIMPSMSDTEREAIEAGTVWWEAELFCGMPRWKKLFAVPPPRLTPEEK